MRQIPPCQPGPLREGLIVPWSYGSDVRWRKTGRVRLMTS